MPNDWSNRVKITGPADVIHEIRRRLNSPGSDGDAPTIFSLKKIVPETKSVKESIKDPDNFWPKYLRKYENAPSASQPFWYIWRYAKWGTKWDTYDSHEEAYEPGGREWIVWFDTANGCPDEALKVLARTFPTITIRHWYSDLPNMVGGYNTYKYDNDTKQVVFEHLSKNENMRWIRRVQDRMIGF